MNLAVYSAGKCGPCILGGCGRRETGTGARPCQGKNNACDHSRACNDAAVHSDKCVYTASVPSAPAHPPAFFLRSSVSVAAPGNVRELHWHPNAAEWALVVDGTCMTTMMDPQNRIASNVCAWDAQAVSTL
eukprot:363736-Chlamydomonas_euryale.AAC.5